MTKPFLTKKVTNQQIYDEIIETKEVLKKHLEGSGLRHKESMSNIRLLWASLGSLAGACGVAFLFLLQCIFKFF